MIAASFGFEVKEFVFFGSLVLVFLATFAVHAFNKNSVNETINK